MRTILPRSRWRGLRGTHCRRASRRPSWRRPPELRRPRSVARSHRRALVQGVHRGFDERKRVPRGGVPDASAPRIRRRRQDGRVAAPVERLHQRYIAGRSIACVAHEASTDATVLFCHGFRGERTGPNRTFVTAARRLARQGVASLRFDQAGSGDSEGDFLESRFTDWIATIRAITEELEAEGRRVALWGQSMGASAAICAAAHLDVLAVVAWVPDANVDPFIPDPHGFVEEGGQRVRNVFWQEAHEADVAGALVRMTAPCFLLFGTADEYVSAENRGALIEAVGHHDRVDVPQGWPHSSWTLDQADDAIERSIDFLDPLLTCGSHRA